VPVCVTVPNGQTVAEIWLFIDVQDGGRRDLGLSKFLIFKGQKDQGDKMHRLAKFRGDRSNRC